MRFVTDDIVNAQHRTIDSEGYEIGFVCWGFGVVQVLSAVPWPFL